MVVTRTVQETISLCPKAVGFFCSCSSSSSSSSSSITTTSTSSISSDEALYSNSNVTPTTMPSKSDLSCIY